MDISKNSNQAIHRARNNGRALGDVFTKPEVVAFMLDEVNYTADKNLSNISVIEPACGLGAFLFELIDRLYSSALRYNFDFKAAVHRNIRAFDIDEHKLAECKLVLSYRYPTIDTDKILFCDDFL